MTRELAPGMGQALTIATVIRRHRFRQHDEAALQQGIHNVLLRAGIVARREEWLTSRSRIDLLVDRVGIEVKVGGSAQALRRQITRYLACPDLDALVVVTSRLSHRVPSVIGDKPVVTVNLTLSGL